MGIATDIAKYMKMDYAGKFQHLPGHETIGVQVAVFYGDGSYERTVTLAKSMQSQHIQIQIKRENDVSMSLMEEVADKIVGYMQGFGAIPLSGIIGLEENKIALEYKVLIKN